MITQIAALTWQATIEMPVDMIPQSVETVVKQGGEFLVYNNEYSNVLEALRNKELIGRFIGEARNHYLQYLAATDELDKGMCHREMVFALRTAGFYSQLYFRDISAGTSGRMNPEIPEFIESHPEFKQFWNQGFENPN